MYMMRLVYHCQRGKTSAVVECLKLITLNFSQFVEDQNDPNI
jgi:hypothetical protein